MEITQRIEVVLLANKLNRHDPATAIPQLEKMISSLSKGQEELKKQIESGGGETPETLYRVDIFALGGTLIESVTDKIDLQARLYSWDVDVTSDSDATWYKWTRDSGDTEADAQWNASHGNGKKTLTVYEQDVGEQATFLCTVNNGDTMYVQSQITVFCNLHLQEVLLDINGTSTPFLDENGNPTYETHDGDIVFHEDGVYFILYEDGNRVTVSETDVVYTDAENHEIFYDGTKYYYYDSEENEVEVPSSSVWLKEHMTITNSLRDEIFAQADVVLSESKEMVDNILEGYVSAEDLLEYEETINAQFLATESGFAMEFENITEAIGNVGGQLQTFITTQETYIRFIDGEIHIGETGENASPVSTVYTQNGLEIRYGDDPVATFKDQLLEVRNIAVDNQIAFFDQWAIRQGAYINGVGYNLNDVWIGG